MQQITLECRKKREIQERATKSKNTTRRAPMQGRTTKLLLPFTLFMLLFSAYAVRAVHAQAVYIVYGASTNCAVYVVYVAFAAYAVYDAGAD